MQVSKGMPGGGPKVTWRKSRRSNPSGDCVEVAAFPAGVEVFPAGVEVAAFPAGTVALRDSRDPSGPILTCTSGGMRAFVTDVKNGRFDRLR